METQQEPRIIRHSKEVNVGYTDVANFKKRFNHAISNMKKKHNVMEDRIIIDIIRNDEDYYVLELSCRVLETDEEIEERLEKENQTKKMRIKCALETLKELSYKGEI